MTAALTPFRVHFAPDAGDAPEPLAIAAATPQAAKAEALARRPGAIVAKIKVDKAAARPRAGDAA
ncbi:hypothetical protein [Aurantimonas sp. VKM B-3413]|uniref:hypothetical protein n=1 Tax=Aurantimonas sp. VKM B-3413 TaxID=2779401 RepID=UPI001E4E31CE|nr:hypothetical protein [Aurantimonas sp. VKM B-3413]MCB8835968.1 hypothetical protein [Aurantimonas sp. VKM B-3413]